MSTLAPPIDSPAEAVRESVAYAALDAYIEQQMSRLRIPGAALAIVEGDRIVHRRGFGKARPGGDPPSPHTPFVLGSTT
jgi:CubicO group peptidase (beta-lactamase class C family)